MTIVTKENNNDKISQISQQAQAIVNQFGPIELGMEIDGTFISVTYDDESLTAQQQATINSELSQLGLN